MKYSRYDPLGWMDSQLAELDRQHLLRELSTHEGPQQVLLRVDGRELVNFGSNDYLGLSADPRVIAAAVLAAQEHGSGSGASPLVSGHSDAHRALETRLAEFEGSEAALLFSSGYAANTSTIAALVGPDDAIFSDEKNHASIIDGCRLSRAKVHVVPHGDTRALEAQLRANTARRLIVTESVFSMDGDFAPLVELADLAQRFDCMLLVDEAHATGVYGPRGRGLSEQLGVESRAHIRIGTLSKALGCAGGFVSGSKVLIDWLVNRARGYVFSTAGPPAVSAAACAAIGLVCDEPWRRETLRQSTIALRERLRAGGWEVAAAGSQIIPLVVGEPQRALRWSSRLREAGLLVPAIRPPSVPAGQSLLRISLTCGHTAEMIERLIVELDRMRGT